MVRYLVKVSWCFNAKAGARSNNTGPSSALPDKMHIPDPNTSLPSSRGGGARASPSRAGRAGRAGRVRVGRAGHRQPRIAASLSNARYQGNWSNLMQPFRYTPIGELIDRIPLLRVLRIAHNYKVCNFRADVMTRLSSLYRCLP